MYRRLVVVAALALSAACTIAPTPREYIDRQVPIDEVRHQAEVQVEDRITSLVQALQQGDVVVAEQTLSPAPDVAIVGPGEGQQFVGAAQARALLELLAATDGGTIEIVEIDVRATPRATSAWFVARLLLHRPGLDAPVPLRASGVYVDREATWELQHAHFSVPVDLFTRLAPPPAAPASPAEAG